MNQEEVAYRKVPSSFGHLTIVWRHDESGPLLMEILLPSRQARLHQVAAPRAQDTSIDRLCGAIRDYLEGNDVELATQLLDWGRCSVFQTAVLEAEMSVPRERVSSYSALAAHLGKPRASRAVGTALARNPFPLIVPCHRTVRSDGSLGGYGGGLEMKRALLEMEGVGFDPMGRVRPEFFWDWGAAS